MKRKIILLIILVVFILTINIFGLDKRYSKDVIATMIPSIKLSNSSLKENLNNNKIVKFEDSKRLFDNNIIAYREQSNNSADELHFDDKLHIDKQDKVYKLEVKKPVNQSDNKITVETKNLLVAPVFRERIEANKPILIDQIQEYRVKTGDSLWTIASKHKIDIDTLIGANDISNMNRIKPGELIKILPVKGILYKIGPGENLSSISNRFEISIQKIVKANQINDPDQVEPGKMLILPNAKPEFGYRDRLEKLFIKPIFARLSSSFGRRWGKMHEGIDFSAPIGTSVKAAGDGRVIYSGWARGYGETVIIEHQKGLKTLYAHNSKLLVNIGEWVNRGKLIAKSGNTGTTTGPNLHFEVQVNGRPVNPISYLR